MDHITFCYPVLFLPSIFASIRVFSNESALHIRWPKYWSFSFNISPSNKHPGLISFIRHNSAVSRLFKVWEDRITFTPTHSGYTIEGLNRDIVRYLSGIEYKFQNRDIL